MKIPLQPAQLGDLFQTFKSSAFRLETLPAYNIPSESAELERFLAGEPLSITKNTKWCELVSAALKAGKEMIRVRLLPSPLTPYMRFEIDWGYLYSMAAGELIYILSPSVDNRVPRQELADFWLFDDNTLVWMQYDLDGHFQGGIRDDDPSTVMQVRQLKDDLLKTAVSFKDYLKRIRQE